MSESYWGGNAECFDTWNQLLKDLVQFTEDGLFARSSLSISNEWIVTLSHSWRIGNSCNFLVNYSYFIIYIVLL